MVERSLSMREVPGSIPGSSKSFFHGFFSPSEPGDLRWEVDGPPLAVRMAERSKALRSGRSPLLWAWVRIPLLTLLVRFLKLALELL
jgi:hypothetical protein